jgi:hypothetical protein
VKAEGQKIFNSSEAVAKHPSRDQSDKRTPVQKKKYREMCEGKMGIENGEIKNSRKGEKKTANTGRNNNE